MAFPVTVVKGKEERTVLHVPDLDGWLKAGWKVKAELKKPVEKKQG